MLQRNHLEAVSLFTFVLGLKSLLQVEISLNRQNVRFTGNETTGIIFVWQPWICEFIHCRFEKHKLRRLEGFLYWRETRNSLDKFFDLQSFFHMIFLYDILDKSQRHSRDARMYSSLSTTRKLHNVESGSCTNLVYYTDTIHLKAN